MGRSWKSKIGHVRPLLESRGETASLELADEVIIKCLKHGQLHARSPAVPADDNIHVMTETQNLTDEMAPAAKLPEENV